MQLRGIWNYLSTGGLPPDFRGFSTRLDADCSLTENDLLGRDDDLPARYFDDVLKLSEWLWVGLLENMISIDSIMGESYWRGD